VCPTCTDTSAQTAAPLPDCGINDRLVELRPLVDETRFEFIDVSNFGAINFLLQNTPDAVVDRVRGLANSAASVSDRLLIILALRSNLEHLRLTQ